MKVILAGSRSFIDHNDPQRGAAPGNNLDINLELLDGVIRRSGFWTRVVNKHHHRGPSINVGRPSKWGNPYSHMDNTLAQFKAATREQSIESYKDWFMEQSHLHSALDELRGKILGCWCDPLPCHAHWLAKLCGTITTVVLGKARGVDTIGERWAERNRLPTDPYPANWDLYGKRAGFLRNTQMAQVADAAILMRAPGRSNGTDHMLSEMVRLGKPYYLETIS